MFKKICLLSSLLFIQSYSYSNTLDNYLQQQNYLFFEEAFKQQITDPKSKKDYLITHINSGHPIIYWLLANEYSKDIINSKYLIKDTKLLDFTKQMIYTSIILTQQDSFYCMEKKPQNASSELLHKYNSILDFERRYTDNNYQIMEKSIDFVKNIQNRPSPNWACLQYGDKMNMSLYGKTFSKTELTNIRNNVNKKLLNSVKR